MSILSKFVILLFFSFLGVIQGFNFFLNFNYDYNNNNYLNLKDQDPVWVRTKEDNWCYGRVTCRSIRVGHTRYVSFCFFFHIIESLHLSI